MIYLRLAEQEDIEIIDTLLRALLEDLGDHHVATIDTLRQAGFREHPAFYAQIAFSTENDMPMGLALYSPLFSTTFVALNPISIPWMISGSMPDPI